MLENIIICTFDSKLGNMYLSFRSLSIIVTVFCLLVSESNTQEKVWSDEEETIQYWNENAQAELKKALQNEVFNKKVAKNVILFVGDGMGIPTITAGRILKGQMNGQVGEEFDLAMDKFPHVGLSKTYSIDRQTTDSAATATAFLCGIKTTWSVLGVSGKARMGFCKNGTYENVDSILVDSFTAGKSTGIVTTTQLAHATPAAAYAHTPDRNWYSDVHLTQDAIDGGCKDIAKQFYESSDMITVALGGGRKYFRSISVTDEVYPDQTGVRQDGRNLVEEWLNDNENRKFVWNKEQLDNLDVENTDKLWGMFEPGHMNYEIDRNQTNEPSIAEMVEKSIEILSKNEKGYFLLVEGGRIDHGHHANSASAALHDVVAFDNAVEKAISMTSEEDTLVIVTADHSHVMSFGGYSFRGSSVFGFADENGVDTKPATSILYGDGPGHMGSGTLDMVRSNPNAKVERENLTSVDTKSRRYLQQSVVPRDSESHGGEDVAIMARGPMSHLIHGVHEQNYIAHVMRYASCLGVNKEHCSEEIEADTFVSFLFLDLDSSQAIVGLYVQFALLLFLSVLVIILSIVLFRTKSFQSRDIG